MPRSVSEFVHEIFSGLGRLAEELVIWLEVIFVFSIQGSYSVCRGMCSESRCLLSSIVDLDS